MKKSYALFLFLLCISMMVGCGGGGGGGSARIPASSVTFETQVPTTALSQSIRAALIPEDIQVLLNGEPLSFVSTVGDVMVYKLTFTTANASFSELLKMGGGEAELQVIVGTKEPVTQKLQLDTLTEASTAKTLTVKLIISNNPADGTYTVEVLGSPGVGPMGAPGQANKSLGITGIDYLATSGEYLPLAYATGVPLVDTTIRVTFDSVVDKADNNFKIALASGSSESLILTHADIDSVFSMTQTDVPASGTIPSHSYLTFVMLTDSQKGQILSAATQYKLSFESSSVRRKSDPSVRLRPFTILTRTFTMENQ